MVGGALSNADHLLELRKERRDRQKNRDGANDETLKGLVGNLIGTNQRLLLSEKNTGVWMNVRGTMVTGAVLLDTEFCDLLCARYNVTPLNLQSHCDGCGTTFEVLHILSYRKGGLVIAHHNKLHDKILQSDQ